METDIYTPSTTAFWQSLGRVTRGVATLFKLRIVLLLLFAALGGAFLGAGGIPSGRILLLTLATGTLAAGGASAINQYLEHETDAQMKRTSGRPLASGAVTHPVWALWIALGMIVGGVSMVLRSNPAMAFYLALGALIYVGVYTIWLKPRSVLNIVIGGAAGSCAVMTGGAAVGAASDPGVITLALLVFLWTPAHFWALAMYYEEDYTKTGVPMLPVRATSSLSAWWIFVHAASTGFAAVILAVHPALGLAYAIPAASMTLLMLASSVRLIRRPERAQAIKTFVTSNIFLALILLAVTLTVAGRQIFFS